MKAAFLFAAILLGFVPVGLAQLQSKDTVLRAQRVTVTQVDAAMAYAPGRVRITGTNLDRITEVRLGGALVPVVANDGQRMLIAPPNQDPGFAQLELVQPTRVLRERIEFMPNLTGRWAGNQVQLKLHPGEPGWFIVNFSFKRLAVPNVYPGTYYMEWLDMNVPWSGQIFGGQLWSGEAVALPWMPVPRALHAPGGLGAQQPMRVQASCMLGDDLCYSNMLTLQPTL